MIRAYIGLGSNLPGHLKSPQDQIALALEEIDQYPELRLIQTSSLYRSDPVGPPGQPDYINAVCAVETALAPEALLDALQAIEQKHHRVRDQHWGPRTLDLDLLLFGQEQIKSPRLTVPHPFMTERSFVMTPLAEIAPGLLVKEHTCEQWAGSLGAVGLDKLSVER